MIRQMVLSTEIEWIGYEDSKKMLQVEFLSGGKYQYQQVPPQVYQSFLSAPSHGKYFEECIKGKYPYHKAA